MESYKKEKIKLLFIDPSSSIREAMKQMDKNNIRLLIAGNESEFVSLLSIGDIQRAIINNINFDDPINKILRSKINVCNEKDNFEIVKAKMMELRAEYMPILSAEGKLYDIIFWDDIINERFSYHKGNLDLPVIIMAGGKGTRLKPITNIIPKALVPIGEKPIIEHIVDNFVRSGVKDFCISVNYKADMIKQYFESINNKQYSVSYINEEKFQGTAGSLSLLKDKISVPFFVTNCDIIIDLAYEDVYDYHKEQQNDLTLVAAIKNYSIPYGTLEITTNGQLTSLKEKPELTFMINAGMYLLQPQLLDYVPMDVHFDITDLIEKVMRTGGKVGVFPVSEHSWFDIGEWKEYNNTQENFLKKFNLHERSK